MGGSSLWFSTLVLPPRIVKTVNSQDIKPTSTPAAMVTPLPGADKRPEGVEKLTFLSKTTDLAPTSKAEDKAMLIIKHPDGRQEGILVTMDMVSMQLGKLQKGDLLVNFLPAPALMGHEPPRLDNPPLVTTPNDLTPSGPIQFPFPPPSH